MEQSAGLALGFGEGSGDGGGESEAGGDAFGFDTDNREAGWEITSKGGDGEERGGVAFMRAAAGGGAGFVPGEILDDDDGARGLAGGEGVKNHDGLALGEQREQAKADGAAIDEIDVIVVGPGLAEMIDEGGAEAVVLEQHVAEAKDEDGLN